MGNSLTQRAHLGAPAKINLWLDIIAKRADGFHELDTCFLAVDLQDEVIAERAADSSGEDTLTVRGPLAAGIPETPANLVLRATAALRAAVAPAAAPALRIELLKNVPHGAGLGGGSSDAAAALKAANALWGRPADAATLHAVAASVGSDCAFFLNGAPARGTGRGECLEPIGGVRALSVVLVFPDAFVSTKEAYGGLDSVQDFGAKSDRAAALAWLRDAAAPPPAVCNAFERSVFARHPQIAAAREALEAQGACIARMSGSGSTCFGIFSSSSAAERAGASLRAAGFRVHVGDTMG